MVSVKNTYAERATEIETYFVFLQAHLLSSRDVELNKILKSNLILMLYNIVESTVTNAIEEIHIDIHRKNISFNDLKIELRESLITFMKSAKGPKPKIFVTSVNDLAIDIVKRCFNKEKISNGNLDHRKIVEISKAYGFDTKTNWQLTKGGACLVDIKGKRNDLAHGTFSFTEIGEKYTIEDLENMKNETVHYLSEIITNIEGYLNRQEYLHVAVAV